MVLALGAAVLFPLELPLLGTNLATLSPETSAWPVNDIAKWSAGWKGEKLVVDKGGNLVSVAGQAEMALPKPIKGRYILTWDGSADVRLQGDGQAVNETSRRVEFEFSGSGPLTVVAKSVDPAGGPVRVRVSMPMAGGVSEPAPHPVSLQRLGFYKVLRLPAWFAQGAEGRWPELSDATYTAGVPIEFSALLAASINADIWIPVPVRWPEASVDSLASRLAKSLPANSRVWIEATTEGSSQTTASDSTKLFASIGKHFPRERVVRVVTGSLDKPEEAKELLETKGLDADALAVSAWIGGQEASADQFFKGLSEETNGRFAEDVAAMSRACKAKGVKLVSYEGGIRIDAAASEIGKDVRMAEATLALLNTWKSKGGSTFVHWMHCSPHPGAAIAFQNQETESAPVQNALLQFALFTDP